MCIFCIMDFIICHVLFDSALNKRGLLPAVYNHHCRWFSPCGALALSLAAWDRCVMSALVRSGNHRDVWRTFGGPRARSAR